VSDSSPLPLTPHLQVPPPTFSSSLFPLLIFMCLSAYYPLLTTPISGFFSFFVGSYFPPTFFPWNAQVILTVSLSPLFQLRSFPSCFRESAVIDPPCPLSALPPYSFFGSPLQLPPCGSFWNCTLCFFLLVSLSSPQLYFMLLFHVPFHICYPFSPSFPIGGFVFYVPFSTFSFGPFCFFFIQIFSHPLLKNYFLLCSWH